MKTKDHDFQPKDIIARHLPHLVILLSSVAVMSIGGCSIPTGTFNLGKSNAHLETLPQKTAETSSTNMSIVPSSHNPNFIVGVVQKVGPAVVRIDASRTVVSQIPDHFDDPVVRRFFGSRSRERVEQGSGSGFIINSGGQILTNSHVVKGAEIVKVKLKDGRSFDGRVMGEDPVTDVAVIKIEANNLPTVSLGNSEVLQPGEAVIAIGNPLGLDYTVTSGIISATGRSSSDIGATDKRVDYIQTDAAINPGNSGGPLLNARGDVIAMNTAIIRGAQGLGFAIPINTAQKIAQELIAKGKVDHPYLGIQMVTLNPEVKEKVKSRLGINLAADKGVLLVDVVPHSPAASAGLKEGDVIQSIDQQSISKIEEVQKILEKSKIGSPVKLQVLRNGQTTQIPVKPAPLPVKRRS